MTSLPELAQNTVAPSLDLPWERDVIALRRDFHAHPEIGFQEVRTSGIVADRLRALGMEVHENIGKTGVVAILKGEQTGPCVLVRADMDALPVTEENNWEWKSKTTGMMHACGHDGHTAIGLCVARILSENREKLRGTVKFMFQPAEEGMGGAGFMINDGVLEDPKPDFALALHIWSTIEVGKIGISTGPVMACADEFRARILGKGGHGAMPDQTVDAVVMAAHVITALQTVVARNVKPLESGVVTIGKLETGTAFNVIPGEAQLLGTNRAFTPETRDLLEKRVREIIETIPKAFGGRGEFQFIKGYPATVNNVEVTERVKRCFEETFGAEVVEPFEPTLGAEDMSMVLEHIPGCYFFVGGRNEKIGAVYPHHHPKFNIDEESLLIGTKAMVAAVYELLG